MRKNFSCRRGVVNVWTILMLFLMIALVGLACDTGWVVLVLMQLQSAADASALAGAQQVKFDQSLARQWAVNLGAANTVANNSLQLDSNRGNAVDGDIVLGRWNFTAHA